MRSRTDGDGDERGWDVVHYYVGGLPDNAAAGLDVGGRGGGWGEDAQNVGLGLLSECCGSVGCECGEVLAGWD